MGNFEELLLRLDALAVFRSLRDDPVVKSLIAAMTYADADDREWTVDMYSQFVSALYEETDNLSEYILRAALEDENVYVRKKGRGEQVSQFIENSVAAELETLQKLSMVSSEEFAELTGCGYLPCYKTEELDLGSIYAERINNIAKYGYGIFSRRHVFMLREGRIVPVENPDPIELSQLCGYERERGEVIANTKALLAGKPANNVLLYGDCGTGKSSTVKAIANQFKGEGLRLIELKKKQLHEIPSIVETVSGNPLKFMIFVDDLSFTEDDDDFAALKAILEGSVSSTASNLCIYATSNRRHLVRETFSAREGDEVHRNDTMQELLSLSDRFGLRVTFSKPDKRLYLEVVKDLARQYQLDMPEDELCRRAEAFALARGGRSPRTAKQFVEYLKGVEE